MEESKDSAPSPTEDRPTGSTSSPCNRLFFPEPPGSDLGKRRRLEVLMEEGDSTDLRQLLSEIDESTLAEFFTDAGGRRLSTRSRRFWSLVLDRPEPEPHPLTEAIWLL